MRMEVYKIINKINNKIYIGITTKTIQQRFKQHVQHSVTPKTNLHKAIQFYGSDNFIIESIEQCNTLSELMRREKFWIDYYKSNNDLYGYNMTEGGESLFNASNRKGTTNAIINGEVKSVTIDYFYDNNLVSPNKNMLTVFKNGESARICKNEYQEYKLKGYTSKNYGFVTVYNKETKSIEKVEMCYYAENKDKFLGINKGKTLYYNFRTKQFKIIPPSKADINQYANKDKIKYQVIDKTGSIVYETLNIDSIPIKLGLKIFKYMSKFNKDLMLVTPSVLHKMKNKYRDYSLIGFKLFVKKYK